MRYVKAVDPEEGSQRSHAVDARRPDQTLCLLSTTSFVVRDEDWENGSHRLSCPECVDLVASQHREWSMTRWS